MSATITNIHASRLQTMTSEDGAQWRELQLGGEHLGVRIEECPPGGSSSVHHYHSLEEEHVLILEGSGTLVLGSDELPLQTGDHIWFAAGTEVAHHIENRSGAGLKYLVFGERCAGDVVVYPAHQVLMVKALGWKRLTYRPMKTP